MLRAVEQVLIDHSWKIIPYRRSIGYPLASDELVRLKLANDGAAGENLGYVRYVPIRRACKRTHLLFIEAPHDRIATNAIRRFLINSPHDCATLFNDNIVGAIGRQFEPRRTQRGEGLPTRIRALVRPRGADTQALRLELS